MDAYRQGPQSKETQMTTRRLGWASILAVPLLLASPLVALGQGAKAPASPLRSESEYPSLAFPISLPPIGQRPSVAEQGEQDGEDDGDDGPSLLFPSPVLGQLPVSADYQAAWFPDAPVRGQGTKLGSVFQEFSFTNPLWQDCRNEWALFGTVRNELFHTGAILPDTGQPFPPALWNVQLGTSYHRQFDNGWVSGGSVSVGSASDKPFHSIHEMAGTADAFLWIPQGEHNAWLFDLSYSSVSQLPFPIPGLAYIWQPSERFGAKIGLPFEVKVRPLDDLTFDFSYSLLTIVHAQATYRLSSRLWVYSSFDWSNEGYFLADRLNDNDLFFYYDKRLTGGVQMVLSDNASLDLSGGYTFDRFYFEGQGYSDRNVNRVDVGSGPFLSLQFLVRW
jgi:hypothetical protein